MHQNISSLEEWRLVRESAFSSPPSARFLSRFPASREAEDLDQINRRPKMVYFTNPEFSVFRTACENDDTALFEKAISQIKSEQLKQYQKETLRYAIRHNSKLILNHLVQAGVSVQSLRPSDVKGTGHTSTETLEFLLTNGWDINARFARSNCGDSNPFMWQVVEKYDMVVWCLNHGADPSPIIDRRKHESPILEKVAGYGDVRTFKLLRSQGCPIGERTLHRAVEEAAISSPKYKDPEKETEWDRKDRRSHPERMAMVRYLVDKVCLDVNGSDQIFPGDLRGCRGQPLCYIAHLSGLDRDTRELTWFLLDRGADPEPGLEEARHYNNAEFVEDIVAWDAKQNKRSICSVQ